MSAINGSFLVTAALSLGLPCFPCGRDKRPVVKAGFKAATTDPAKIAELFATPGSELIGVPTGAVSGLVAVDVDVRADKSGMDWLDAHIRRIPDTRTHQTRSRGQHLVFRNPNGHDIRNSASRIAPGIDVRGNGGFIIVPPSPGYQVINHAEPAEMPAWLVQACLPTAAEPPPEPRRARQAGGCTRYGLAALRDECEAVRRAGFGSQEHTLNAAALKIGALIAGGELDESAMADLLAAGRVMSSEPGRSRWSPSEIETKVRRGIQDGKSKPRVAPQRPYHHPSSLDDAGSGDEDAATPKPEIHVVAGDLHLLATRAENAMIIAGLPVYQRGRRLVRPATQEVPASKGRMTIAACFVELSQSGVVDMMSQTAVWTRYDGRSKKVVVTDPPKTVADILLSRFGAWQFPPVSGLITTPTLRPDHSILCQAGYDPLTRLFLVSDPALILPTVPPRPSRAQAEAALVLLDGLLDGFPFVTAVDRSVALSALLTPVCRGAISVAPLHVFRASTAGTGKSYLADVATAIAAGRPCPVASVSSKEAETESRLVGLLLAGFPVISLDNVNGELGFDLLCQAVERPLVRVRKLGGSDIFEVETRATIFATGNALRVRGDMTRRTLVCDLDAQMERPELRSFAFDPVERVLADRGRYVAAALTVVRAFVLSGEQPSMAALGSYDDYSATVREALVWLGWPDPALSMERAREDDSELVELRAVMIGWRQEIEGEKTAKEARKLAEDKPDSDLNQALLAVAAGRHGIDTDRLGNLLRSWKGRIVSIQADDGAEPKKVRFVSDGKTGGVVRWKLEKVG